MSQAQYPPKGGVGGVLRNSLVYRPGSRPATKQFFKDLTLLLESLATHCCPVIVTGDFNVRVDRSTDSNCVQLGELLASFDLVQHVQEVTHDQGGILDLVITRPNDVVSKPSVNWNGISDHALLTFSIKATKSDNCSSVVTARCWKNLNKDLFELDLKSKKLSQISSYFDGKSLNELCDLYDKTLTQLLDKHAPKKTQTKRVDTPWFDVDCRAAKRRARRLKRRYYKSKLDCDRRAWISELKTTAKVYEAKRNSFWSKKINENSANSKKLWHSLNAVLGRCGKTKQPMTGLSSDDFLQFFNKKTDDVALSTARAPRPVITQTATTSFSSYAVLGFEDVTRLIKQCALDPAPTWLIKENCVTLAPFFEYFINRSLDEGYLPQSQKSALVSPLVKKPSLDKTDLKVIGRSRT